MARPPDHAGQEGGDDDQQADADADPDGQGRFGEGGDRQQYARGRGDDHGAHGHEMQPADAERAQDGGAEHPLDPAAPRQESHGADQQHAADHGDDDQRGVPRQDRPGEP
ncbi:hypothetical protein D3C80_1521270 [compost metagenome]